ncbi:MAG: hypothetical protein K6L74_17125 [Neptuniibacter sp.]
MERSDLIEKGILGIAEKQLKLAQQLLETEDRQTAFLADTYGISIDLAKQIRINAYSHTVTQLANLLDYDDRHGFSKEVAERLREIDNYLWTDSFRVFKKEQPE